MAVEALMKNPQGAMPMQAPMQERKQPQPLNISPQEFENAVQNLSPEALQALDKHLTPSVKQALGELLGSEVVETVKNIGPTEPTVSVPLSVVAKAYPAQEVTESIKMMEQDFMSKAKQTGNDIPISPQGGLGGEPMKASPQTNVPPMSMA